MLNINNLPDYKFRPNESFDERRERRQNEMRASGQYLNVSYVKKEDGFGNRTNTRERTSREYLKVYVGAIVAVEIDEGSFYGRTVERVEVQGIENLHLTMEELEDNVHGIYGKTIIRVYKVASMIKIPTMSHARTEVHHEHTAFGTKTTTVHVEETYTPHHRPTVTVTASRPSHREIRSTEEAVGTLAGALLGMAMVGLAKSRR